MKKNEAKRRLSLATGRKTPFEVFSIILKGVSNALQSLFIHFCVMDNIEGMMQYINEKHIITKDEYRKLLMEARDFYPVILCALVIDPIKRQTTNFRCKELVPSDKERLFCSIYKSIFDFFLDWPCQVEVDPLLFYRLSVAYGVTFNMELCMRAQSTGLYTALEERVFRIQVSQITSIYIVEQVATALGLAGLDYIDYYRQGMNLEDQDKRSVLAADCIDTIV